MRENQIICGNAIKLPEQGFAFHVRHKEGGDPEEDGTAWCGKGGLLWLPTVWCEGFCLRQVSHYVAQLDLQFGILLPRSFKYWDYRHKLPHTVCVCYYFQMTLLSQSCKMSLVAADGIAMSKTKWRGDNPAHSFQSLDQEIKSPSKHSHTELGICPLGRKLLQSCALLWVSLEPSKLSFLIWYCKGQ